MTHQDIAAAPHVLLLFEDAYFSKLMGLLKKLRRDINPGAVLPLEAASVNGYGNFADHIRHSLRSPSPRRASLPALIVAVADADRAHEFGAGIPKPVGHSPAQSQAWVLDAEERWQSRLLHNVDDNLPRERLAVCLLRWSKESVLTASPEIILGENPKVAGFLERCSPPPLAASPADFLSYRRPEQCMKDCFKSFNKNRDGDDLLDKIAGDKDARRRLRERLPDLERLASFLAGLG